MTNQNENNLEGDWYPSKWGAADELGALNEISPEKIAAAAKLVRSGKIYNLAHMLEFGIPVHWFHGQFIYSTFHRHLESVSLFGTKNNFGAMNIRLELGDHTGTHLDGLNHISIKDTLYNGNVGSEISGPFGTSKLGMEKVLGVFTRGVLADIASFKHVNRLEKSYVITEKDMTGSLNEIGLEIRPGDAVLIATGWSQLWMADNTSYAGPCPGIGISAARWIREGRASLVGSDTWNVEVDPSEDPAESGIVHQYLITKNGIRLLENLNLEELRQDKVREFLFIAIPLRIKGGAGSPITPIAVV